LLIQGKIRSTPEAVYAALQRAPDHLARSKAAVIGAIEGVYWAMIDSAQAALITAGKVPPSPEHVPMLLKEAFVDKNMLSLDDIRILRDIYLVHKSILHRQNSQIKGMEIDIWQEKAEKFIVNMTSIISKILESEKK